MGRRKILCFRALKKLGLITERTRDQWLKLGMMTPGKNAMLEEVLTHGEAAPN